MDKSNKLKKKEYEFDLDDDDNNNYGKIFPGYEKAVNFAVKILLKDFDGELTKSELEKLLGEDIEGMDI